MRNHTYDDENKYQEYYDAAWDEIEPSNKNRNTAPVKPASDSTDKNLCSGLLSQMHEFL